MSKLLVRASSLAAVNSEPREKSPLQHYNEAVEMAKALEAEIAGMRDGLKSKETKKLKLAQAVEKAKALESEKDGIFISKTAQKKIKEIFVNTEYRRYRETENKYVKKGRIGEEDGITMLSLFDRRMYRKNDIRLSNEYITGECDIYLGESIENAEETVDIKCSWDVFTFFDVKDDELNDDYFGQGQGYMWLTKAKKHTVAYVLINTPKEQINAELYKESFKWRKSEIPLWRQLQIVSNMIYDEETFKLYCEENNLSPVRSREDDTEEGELLYKQALAVYLDFVEIPFNKRVHKISFDFDEEYIEKSKVNIEKARKWLLSKGYTLSNKAEESSDV